MFEDVNPKGAIDMPDERDYQAEHILGKDDAPLPEKVKFLTRAHNQGRSVKCTAYSTYHVGQILNEIEHNTQVNSLPDAGWELQKKFGTYSKEGDYVQTALKSIVRNGLKTLEGFFPIDGYAKIEKKDIDYWLAKGFPIITSSFVTASNFKKAKHDGIWGGNDGPHRTGHAFALIGYEPFYKLALNSYGEDWGKFKNGTFLIREEDVSHLNTCYILYDRQDMKYLFKDLTSNSWAYDDVKWAKDNGLVKGYDDNTFRPDAPITRAEAISLLKKYDESRKRK